MAAMIGHQGEMGKLMSSGEKNMNKEKGYVVNIIFFYFSSTSKDKKGVTHFVETAWNVLLSSELQHILAIIVVIEFPPRLSFSSHVSTESL